VTFEFHPVTPDRWPDLDRLFSAAPETRDGDPPKCWCMEWRLPRAQWEAQQGEGNRRAMQAFIESGQVPGILAYAEGEAVAWCSISPRAQHSGLKEMGSYRWFENPEVWTVTCFYVRGESRGQGLMTALLQAAVDYAKEHGARVVEGHPVDPETTEDAEFGLYMGTAPTFRKAGFVEVARGAYNRPVMRYYVEQRQPAS